MLGFIKKNKYVIMLCCLLAIVSYGGYKYYNDAKNETVSVKTGKVKVGEITKTIAATGSLSAVDNVDISSKITGRIVEVLVSENQHVKAGDVLVRLDDTSLRAAMGQMKAKLDNAQTNYYRYGELLAKGAVSQSAYDDVLSNYIVAKTNYDKAVSDVQDTVITTPIDGYVIGKPTPVGQTISSGISTPQVIMSVATLDNMQIEALVDESDIGQIAVGQKVDFTVDAYNDETFTGIVRLISKSATKENNVIYYKVYVSVDNAKGKLLPTMTARANIVIERAENIMTVPLNCIHSDGTRRYVVVYDEVTKASREVDVNVGISSDSEVAVTSDALREGDTVLVKKAVAKQTGNHIGPMH